MKPSSIDDCETFRLDDDCIGVVWHDGSGWYGCLHWEVEGDTGPIGAFTGVIAAREAVRAAFVMEKKQAELRAELEVAHERITELELTVKSAAWLAANCG